MLLRGYLGPARTSGAGGLRHALRQSRHRRVLEQLKADGCERFWCCRPIRSIRRPPRHRSTTRCLPLCASAQCAELRFIKHYHDHEAYIQALKDRCWPYWAMHGAPRQADHEFPRRAEAALPLGDPYHCECQKTARLLAQQLGLGPEQYQLTFQSRFGKAEWLQPYTAPTLQALAKQGVKRVDVMCPGFTSDCLETLEEIAIEAKQDFLHAGGKEFHFIPCLNQAPGWIAAMATVVEEQMIGWPTHLSEDEREELKQQAEVSKRQALNLGASQ